MRAGQVHRDKPIPRQAHNHHPDGSFYSCLLGEVKWEAVDPPEVPSTLVARLRKIVRALLFFDFVLSNLIILVSFFLLLLVSFLLLSFWFLI